MKKLILRSIKISYIHLNLDLLNNLEARNKQILGYGMQEEDEKDVEEEDEDVEDVEDLSQIQKGEEEEVDIMKLFLLRNNGILTIYLHHCLSLSHSNEIQMKH